MVTGGGRGIGRATAIALATQGRAVAVGDIRDDDAERTVAEIENAGGTALAVRLDVTDGGSVREAVETIERALGPVDVLVNNAGWDELHPFLETDEPFWDRVIAINYKGCLHVTKAVLPGMVERAWGRIVSVSSDAGRVGSSGESVYAGCKAAVIAFTKTIAREVARSGVTANSVCPGPTRTPLLEGMMAEGEAGQKLVAALTRAVPMKRLGEPEDVAGAVVFLTAEHAGYITGQTLSVSGGMTMA